MSIVISIIALILGLYGSILSTYEIVKKNKRIKVKYGQGFLFLKDKTIVTYSTINLINKSDRNIYIKYYGFKTNREELNIEKIDKKRLREIEELGFSIPENKFIEKNVNDEKHISSIEFVEPGQAVTEYFYTREIKKRMLDNPTEKIYLYCIDQTGYESVCIVPNKFVLLSKEPVY